MTLRRASAFTFELESTTDTSSHSGRLGLLLFRNSPRRIPTPAILPNTNRGYVPHISNDQVAAIPLEALYLSLEQLIDTNEASYSSCPYSIRRFLGLSALDKGGPLLVMGLKDPTRVQTISLPSSDNHACIQTGRGYSKMSIEKFVKIHAAKPPDIVIAISDEPDTASPSKKRLHKSVTRSTQWLKTVTKGLDCDIFASLVGSDNLAARQAYAGYLLEEDDSGHSIDQLISGYMIHLNPYSSFPHDQLVNLLDSSLQSLPVTKPRMAACPSGVVQLLRLIRDVGLDIFVDDWSYSLATLGVALDFDFPAPPKLNKGLLGINLFRTEYKQSFVPLSSSSLATESTARQPTTRAYLHHLLTTHEMTAHVLLALHNTRIMRTLMERVRSSIKTGSFAEHVLEFEVAYEEECSAAHEAKEMLTAVELERGKGRMKRERERELAAQIQDTDSLPIRNEG